jgi:hypothetical protein
VFAVGFGSGGLLQTIVVATTISSLRSINPFLYQYTASKDSPEFAYVLELRMEFQMVATPTEAIPSFEVLGQVFQCERFSCTLVV